MIANLILKYVVSVILQTRSYKVSRSFAKCNEVLE